MNRTQFWIRYLGAIAVYIVTLTAIAAFLQGDEIVVAIVGLALFAFQLRVLFLRACDVGYTKPGWMTAAVLIPFVGFFVLLTIGFLPTGSRLGSQAPRLATA
jgi:uncharacterized membrane protein YhaH (DUF805 family)